MLRIVVFREQLNHIGQLIRLACVMAVAMASILHLADDFRSMPFDTLSIGAAQTDAGRSAADATVEVCHFCAVVAMFATAQNLDVAAVAAAIPAGRVLHMFAFRQPATAPPPRILI